MRNPNGYGSIVKLSGKRRKPFMVRAAAKEVFNADTGTAAVERPVIGCYATRKEALEELAKYNASPYDINMRKITLENDFVQKDYSEYITINIPDDDCPGTSWNPVYVQEY